MGGNKNCNDQNFLKNTYGYFTSLQKFHHAELAIGGLVVTSPLGKNQSLPENWLAYQFSTQEERKPLGLCKEKKIECKVPMKGFINERTL